jgi:hypothetical protein
MYAVRRWDEETVIKWLAVGMVLAMVGIAAVPVLQAPEIGAVATAYTGNPGFAAAGVFIDMGIIKFTPELVEALILLGLVSSPVTAAAIVIGAAIAIPL